MKIIIMLLLFLTCGMSNSNNIARGESMYESIYTLDSMESQRCITPSGVDGLWMLTSKELIHWNPGSGITDRVDNSKDFILVAENNDTVYGITSSLSIYKLIDNDWLFVSQTPINSDENVRRGNITTFNECIVFSHKDKSDQIVLWLWTPENNSFKKHVNVFSSTWISVDSSGEHIVGLQETKDSRMDASSWGLLEWNPVSLDKRALTPVKMYSTEWAYDGSVLYCSVADHIISFLDGGVEGSVYGVPPMSSLLCLNNGSFAGIHKRSLSVFAPISKEQSNPLTIFNYETGFNQEFTQHTGIIVEQYPVRDAEISSQISEILVTQNPDVDVISFWSHDGLSDVINKGYYYPLNESRLLVESFKELYPNIAKAVLAKDGCMTAWPVTVSPNARTVDAELLNAGYSSPQTWDELLDLLPRLVDDCFFENNDMVPFDVINYCKEDLLFFFTLQYINTQTAPNLKFFDTAEFRHIVERILHEVPYTPQYTRSTGLEIPLFCMSTGSNIIDDQQLLPLQFDGTPSHITAPIRVLVVNPYSDNIEGALAYLEYFATKRTIEDYTLYSTMTDPLINPSVRKEIEKLQEKIDDLHAKSNSIYQSDEYKELLVSLKDEMVQLEESLYIVTSDDIEQYQRIASQIVVPVDNSYDYEYVINGYVNMLVNSTISLDDFIEKLTQILEMIQGEQF